jgi:mRNA-degrading endonuclease YafQ of YafQ-DinJ toxin-antitoxin module
VLLSERSTGTPNVNATSETSIENFIAHPFDRSLRTHRLSGKLRDYWSFTVEYDLRVIFYFDEKDRAVFIDIGSPREVY